jgi:hypothetical protein
MGSSSVVAAPSYGTATMFTEQCPTSNGEGSKPIRAPSIARVEGKVQSALRVKESI